MRCLFISLCFLLFGSLSAKMIGNVEYQLPPSEQEWELVNHISDSIEKSSTLIYVSESESNDEYSIVFAAHINAFPLEGTDGASIEEAIQSVFQGQTCTISVLENSEDSFLVEWANDNFYCLSRAFSINNGTVMLQVMTENLDLFNKEKLTWINTLKEAKQKK